MRDETAVRQPVISPDCRALVAVALAAAEEARLPKEALHDYNSYSAVIARTDRLIAALGYRVTGTVTEGMDT